MSKLNNLLCFLLIYLLLLIECYVDFIIQQPFLCLFEISHFTEIAVCSVLPQIIQNGRMIYTIILLFSK